MNVFCCYPVSRRFCHLASACSFEITLADGRANLHCQLDWICNHLEDSLWVCVRWCFQWGLNEVEKHTLNMNWEFRLNKRGKWVRKPDEQYHSFFSAFWLWMKCQQIPFIPVTLPSPLWWTVFLYCFQLGTKVAHSFLKLILLIFCHSNRICSLSHHSSKHHASIQWAPGHNWTM